MQTAIRKGFWKSIDNQKKFFDAFARDFGIKTNKDWGSVTYQDIVRKGGGSLLVNQYRGSVLRAVRNVYKRI